MNTSYRKFVMMFLAIVIVAGGGYFVWDRYFSEAGQARRMAAEQEQAYAAAEKNYLEAMKSDTYGGKTPKETLDLFVSALRAGDVELASKYFLISENATRDQWVTYLAAVKEKGLLAKMAEDIVTKAMPGNSSEDQFAFVLYNKSGTVGLQIGMRLNSYTGLWKIESLN